MPAKVPRITPAICTTFHGLSFNDACGHAYSLLKWQRLHSASPSGDIWRHLSARAGTVRYAPWTPCPAARQERLQAQGDADAADDRGPRQNDAGRITIGDRVVAATPIYALTRPRAIAASSARAPGHRVRVLRYAR